MDKITGLKIVRSFDLVANQFGWGIDAQIGRKWYHLQEGFGHLFYPTQREAAKKIKSLARELGVLPPETTKPQPNAK